jgi:Cu+-exporting ATPase
MTANTGLGQAVPTSVALSLGGMTCASCAARIEKRLNKLDGVDATVNYALERASVTFQPTVSTDDLVAAVEAIGYRATLVSDAPSQPESDNPDEREEASALHSLRMRLTLSALLTLPVFVIAMVPSVQFDSWQWLSLALAGPVVIWGGWPFHRAAWLNLRHASASMDTLISLGTLAAFSWSLWALSSATPVTRRCG